MDGAQGARFWLDVALGGVCGALPGGMSTWGGPGSNRSPPRGSSSRTRPERSKQAEEQGPELALPTWTRAPSLAPPGPRNPAAGWEVRSAVLGPRRADGGSWDVSASEIP